MAHRGLLGVVLVVAVLAPLASALACNCPKGQLIKKYGTVSQIHQPHQVPLPPPLPLTKASAQAGG